jgi:hypothetical protein
MSSRLQDMVDLLKSRLEPASPGVYSIHRQDAAFFLAGSKATEVLAQTCGSDLRTLDPRWNVRPRRKRLLWPAALEA